MCGSICCSWEHNKMTTDCDGETSFSEGKSIYCSAGTVNSYRYCYHYGKNYRETLINSIS